MSENIDQFRFLTNTSFEEARDYLILTEGNIEQAVTLFYEGDIRAPLQSSSRLTSTSSNNENNNTTIKEKAGTTSQNTKETTIHTVDVDENTTTTVTTIDDDEFYETDEFYEVDEIDGIDEIDGTDEIDESITTTIPNTATTTNSFKTVLDVDDSMDLDKKDDKINKASQINADEELARRIHQQEESTAAVRPPIQPKSDILIGTDTGGENRDSYSIACESKYIFIILFAGHVRIAVSREKISARVDDGHCDSAPEKELTRNKAKSTGKWIMINIQNIEEFSSQLLNCNLWSNETVKDFNSDSSEGSKYINFYPVYKYPHIAVIDPRTGERLKVWDSQLEPTEFLITVTDFLEKYSLEEEPNHSESSKKNKTSDETSAMSVDNQTKAEPQISNDTNNIINDNNIKEEKEIHKVHPVFEEIPYKSIFDSIKPIERPDQTGPKSTSIKFRLEDRHVIKKFNKKDSARYMFEYLKASVPELEDKFFELNYLRNNLIEKIDETIEEAGLINAAINVVLG
ncbi:15185_t:CDS:10 [Entrophospora sp. SA101]|nr:15185_t:CDS:10 [Entrophospora sp. SA101]